MTSPAGTTPGRRRATLALSSLLAMGTGACGPSAHPGAAGGSGGADAGPDGGYQPRPPGRVDVKLGDGWRFLRADATGAEATAFDDTAAPWTDVTLPHTWNALDGEDTGAGYYRGVGWYRRHLAAPADLAASLAGDATGRRAYLQFDGANNVTDVYVNGTHLGQHRGGFAAFRYDVTAALIAGDNLIAVKIDNRVASDVPPLSADFTFFGGLYRDVHLLTTDALHVDVEDFASSGIYVTTSHVVDVSADFVARVRVKSTAVATPRTVVSLALVDASGTLIQRLTKTVLVAADEINEVIFATTVTPPHLWNGRRDPYLYTAYVEVGREGAVTDVVAQPFGFRSFFVDPVSGFFLNGSTRTSTA